MKKYVSQATLRTLPKYVEAIEQNALGRRVRGLSGGGGTKRNRRRVDGLSTDFDLGLHGLAAAAGGGGSGTVATRCQILRLKCT